MGHLLNPMLSGYRGIGYTGGENGFGCPDIGEGLRDLIPFGSLVTGSREGEAGSGLKDTGHAAERRVGSHMFGLGLPEILIILAIFLLLFGAKKLPDIGAGLGKTVKELRKIRGDRRAEEEKEKGDRKENLVSDLRKEVEEFPGLKEARTIKETAKQVKEITKLLK